ncbi:uncharacterized protein LOC130988427 [Salvia miltiorrhiza]|uniref:uncharacterized protein LOC130988427 n=1 Tax=Salvia miltiorrhiza TaxID=226208 RepID=UPI0025AD5C6B|nr:uncharacterized protein LOC130988427 [Salvia miltiorrhiza]XP_057768240.1 uncharacterized protein LOC130988427 [Salvia miltiorrhiza]
MECNKDEAVRVRELAEMKMKNNDFEGARKNVLKAQNLYPELENISQLLSICDVHCSAKRLVPGSEKDWYGVLQVAKFADEMAIKKQYRRLALFLHPDKNRFPGAESAFKLICEANAVLSDPQKKYLYDQKIRVMVRSTPVVPPHHHLNKTSQFNKQYGPEIKVANGFRSMNQHQTTQSSFSVRQEVFCTSCPFCSLKYQLDRKFVNKNLRCQKCTKTFTGYETGAQGIPEGVPLASKYAPGSSQNGIPNHGGSKHGVQNGKGSSASHMASQWCANKQTQPSVQTESIFKDKGVGRPAKVSRKAKRKGRRRGSESSESYDTSSESDLEDVYGVATNPSSGPSNAHFPRRSSRKRQNISYNEGVGDDDDDDDDLPLPSPRKRSQGNKLPEDNGIRQNNALDGESAKHENQNGLHADADFSKTESKETGSVYPEERPQNKSYSDTGVKTKGEGGRMPNIGADAIETEIDSDRDAHSGDDSIKDHCECDDPEFNDFDKDRDENCFAVSQYWACYDSADSMPRFYAKVKKVQFSPFELWITWLEADPADDAQKKWIDADLPVGCGNFKVGATQKMSNRFTFAQQVHCEKGKRGSLIIYPRRGEVWALFKDWDLSWSSQPDSRRKYKYEVVEVLSDFDAVAGVRVCYLDKVGGFVSLFQRSSQSATESFMIRPNEVYRFSHCICSFKMTGSEREGVPVGSFELDPAALPLNPDHLYYPGKSKMGTDNTEPGVNCAPPESGTGKDNFVDLECSDG